jgi:hypothetical protein
MARQSGRLFFDELDRGIPSLLIEVLDVTRGDRLHSLGSAPTDDQGTFDLEISLPARSGLFLRDRSDWDLQLEVLAPERVPVDRSKGLLFKSEVLRNAGRRENFHIRYQLLPFGLLVSRSGCFLFFSM